MTIQTINIGAVANDGTGDGLREGGEKINANFAELDTRVDNAQAVADSASASAGNLATRVTNLETADGELESQINTVDQTVVNQGNDIAQLQTVQLEHESRLDAAEAAIVELEAGGAGGSTPAYPERRTMTLFKNLFGRHKTLSISTTTTHNIAMELETHFMGFRIGIPNVSANQQAGIKVSVGFLTSWEGAAWLVDITPKDNSWLDLTFGGAATATLAPRHDVEVPSYTWSDVMPFESELRTDGVQRPMIIVRIEYPAGTVASVPFLGVSGWRNSTSPRGLKMSTQQVAGVTDKAAFTQTLNTESNICVPAVQYHTNKAGRQLLIVGDSTMEGVQATPNCYGAAQTAAYSNSTPNDPIEYWNAALHSQWPMTYQLQVPYLLPMIRPTCVVYSPYSVNEAFPGTGLDGMGTRHLKNALFNVLEAIRASKMSIRLILTEGLPVNPAGKDLGAGDATRVSINNWLATLTGPVIAVGYANSVSGTVDADGQIPIATGFAASDNLHINGDGTAVLANVLTPLVTAH